MCARAKVTDLHLHDLRAEFASLLSEANVPVEQVRDDDQHVLTVTREPQGRLPTAHATPGETTFESRSAELE